MLIIIWSQNKNSEVNITKNASQKPISYHTATPNNLPTAAVKLIASAPQNVTLIVSSALKTFQVSASIFSA